MDEIKNRLKQIVCDVTKMEMDEIDETENLFSLGLNSMMLYDIDEVIFEEFGVSLSVELVTGEIDTIEKIAEYLNNNKTKDE